MKRLDTDTSRTFRYVAPPNNEQRDTNMIVNDVDLDTRMSDPEEENNHGREDFGVEVDLHINGEEEQNHWRQEEDASSNECIGIENELFGGG